MQNKNPIFEYKGRNYEQAVRDAERRARAEARYPSTAYNMGFKEILGEHGLFILLIKEELKKSNVPTKLIEKITSPDVM